MTETVGWGSNRENRSNGPSPQQGGRKRGWGFARPDEERRAENYGGVLFQGELRSQGEIPPFQPSSQESAHTRRRLESGDLLLEDGFGSDSDDL